MKILFCAPFQSKDEKNSFSPGGDRLIRLTISTLLDLGHEVFLVNSSNANLSHEYLQKPSINHWNRIKIDNNNSVPLFIPHHISNRRLGIAFQSLIAPYYANQITKAQLVDLVWIYNAGLFEARLALSLYKHQHIPFILQLADHPLSRKRSYLNIKPKLDFAYFPDVCKYAASVLVINSYLHQVVKKYRLTNNIILFPPIIDPVVEKVAKNREDRPFQKNVIRVGYFGELSEEKGVGQLIKVIDLVGENYQFNFAGVGGLENYIIKKSSEEPNKVTFHGFIEDRKQKGNLLCNMDILVNPHSNISNMQNGILPFKLLEYIVSESYVITTQLPPISGVNISVLQIYDGSDRALVDELLTAKDKYSASKTQEIKQQVLKVAGYDNMKKTIELIVNCCFENKF